MPSRMAKLWELYCPTLAGMVALFLSVHFRPDPHDVQKFVGDAINLGSMIIGFLGTMASILSAMNGKSIDFLRRIKKFEVIMDYIFKAIRWSLASIVLSVLIEIKQDLLRSNFLHIWVAVTTIAFVSSFRAIDVVTTVLRSAASSDD